MRIQHLLVAAACLAATAVKAQAHAFLDHADPKVGGTVQASPPTLKAWFTQRLVLPFTNLQVFDAAGKEVHLKDKKLDSSNQALLTVTVPKLKPGTYKVVWHAVSVDTHVTNGTYSFTVSQ